MAHDDPSVEKPGKSALTGHGFLFIKSPMKNFAVILVVGRRMGRMV
ncbi:hypothetical protein AOX55_00002332 [Sinorhizobium fredii CCBAU 25509]|nr:hypothetical protein SF83666_c20790 [Sinorhizobium fredii CCBAU 83666]AWM25583.1 hypothetical protein AOX55_00002332 [Sinorhizobium fredii CCBAU 25509]